MNIVQVKKYYLPVKAKVNQSIEETKFTYPPLGKMFEKKKKLKMLLKNKEERLKKQLRNKKSIYKL